MKTYQVFFTHTIEERFEVRANSAEEAEALATQKRLDGGQADMSSEDETVVVQQRKFESIKPIN